MINEENPILLSQSLGNSTFWGKNTVELGFLLCKSEFIILLAFK